MKILFVCTGNTCRSPMAEGLARDYADKNALDITASSAGLFINDIDGTAENAITVMNELGIDISAHTPTQLTLETAENADIIVPMTQSHRMALESAGISPDKIRCFDCDIPDPYMQSVDVYRQCRDALKSCIVRLIDELSFED